MCVVSLFVIGVCATVAPVMTTVHTALILKLFSSPVSTVSTTVSLRIVFVVVIIPYSIIPSRFTALFAIGE